MKIIVGHGSMDLDCIGSIILAKYIFPDHVPVQSHLVHPVHPAEGRDIPGARIHEGFYGSNTTGLGLELIQKGIFIEPEDATIALTGIYADTGNFTHANVKREDFEVAAFLLAQGASLKLVKDFLVPLKEKQQVVLFHEILNLLEKRSIRSHLVQLCYMELEDDAQGLGAVIEQVFEVENGEILFGFFFFRKKAKMLIIRRNNNAEVCLNDLLSGFGGGGHRQAASATVKTDQGRVLVERLIAYQEEMLQPAATAQMHVPVRNFMSRKMLCAGLDATVREIDEMLFENNIGHLPIVAEGRVVGIVTRADFLRFKLSDRRRKAELLQEMGLPLARSLSDLSVLD